MTKYQLLFIINNDLEESKKDALTDKISALIESLGGVNAEVNKWGTKAYAYPIEHKKEGYYVLINFEATATAPLEIDRQMRNNENIVRHMITLA
ncbi:MAG: 30S ribosomal protein S6 [Firmicutes bacterium]|nr:30S ribosomal protein S6 [Bacillota bacterium]